jgi:hypothetical protein
MEFFVFLGILGVIIGAPLYLAHQGKERERELAVDRRILALLVEFPEMTDLDIAHLAHDELVNNRISSRAALNRASPYSVARIRRTLLVTHARNLRKRADSDD